MVRGLSGEVRALTYVVSAAGGRRQIIDIPALSLAPGTVTALAGPSGSGKSTLLYLLAGLLAPETGAVSWGGVELAEQTEAARDRWRHDNAGFVFQSFNLIDELSPLENVLVPALFGRRQSGDLAGRAVNLLDNLGAPRDRRRSDLLSNGEQQRVAIARALLLDPPVIFADEPTASLDARAGATVVDVLRRLAGEEGRTIVVASHDPAVLAAAGRVVGLDHGRLAAEARLEAAQ